MLRNLPSAPTNIIPFPGSFAAATWGASNRATFIRFSLAVPGTYRYVGWNCNTASGNVQVGVVSLSGSLHSTWTLVASTGVITCPTAADIRSDIGSTYLPAGDYALFFWADNTTVKVSQSSGIVTSFRVAGLTASLASGVTGTGTVTWGSLIVPLSLEMDI